MNRYANLNVLAVTCLLVGMVFHVRFAEAGKTHPVLRVGPAAVGTAKEAARASSPIRLLPPRDPCLQRGFTDWHDLSVHAEETASDEQFVDYRIVIYRAGFQLILQGIRGDGSTEPVYQTSVGLGAYESRTPLGRFLINHVYCYPDLLFYTDDNQIVPAVYDGFLAPLIVCDDEGVCERYRGMGLHGFNAAAHPDPEAVVAESVGPVSAGCIRVPHPCEFKSELIGRVGIGPTKRNERGSYHWLKRPVEVWIFEDEGFSILSILQTGLRGLRQILAPTDDENE